MTRDSSCTAEHDHDNRNIQYMSVQLKLASALHMLPLPPGVERHGKTLRINFMYQGVRCREIVERDQIDSVSIAIAARRRSQVVESIAAGRFNYLQQFPDSPTAARFFKTKVEQEGSSEPTRTLKNLTLMTVAQGVADWLKTQGSGKAKATLPSYTSASKHVLLKFGERYLADVTSQELKQFRNLLVRSKTNLGGLSPKTVNNVLIVVRGVWNDAKINGITTSNRAEGVENHVLQECSEADPFSLAEMQQLLVADQENLATARMVVCNCWIGLSRSELVALAIEDVDLERKKLSVRRAFVLGEHKAPKERTRARKIDLLDDAVELLRMILADAVNTAPQTIEVTALDNLTVNSESVRLLFRNPRTGESWSQSALDRWFKAHTNRTHVRYRGVNQCRHTFASRALSNFAPKEWVIHQLGHADEQMLKKHYARWLPSEMSMTPALVENINTALKSKLDTLVSENESP